MICCLICRFKNAFNRHCDSVIVININIHIHVNRLCRLAIEDHMQAIPFVQVNY